MHASFTIFKDLACAPSEYFIWSVEFSGITAAKLAPVLERVLGHNVLRPFTRDFALLYGCGHFAAEHVHTALVSAQFIPTTEALPHRGYYKPGDMHSAPAAPSPLPGALASAGARELSLFVQFSRHCALVSRGAFTAERDPFLTSLASWPPDKAATLADFEALAESCDPASMRPALLALSAARKSLAARSKA